MNETAKDVAEPRWPSHVARAIVRLLFNAADTEQAPTEDERDSESTPSQQDEPKG